MTKNEIKELAKEPELLSKEETLVVAGRTWSSMGIKRMVCLEGKTIKEILLDAMRHDYNKEPTEFQKFVWLDRCRCKVNGIEIPFTDWDTAVPQAGSFVEFLVAPGKGGGGKNLLSTVLMVAVVAAAVVTQQWYLTNFGTATFTAGAGASLAGSSVSGAAASAFVGMGAATWTTGTLAASALAGMSVLTIGTYAASKICPMVTSPQQQLSSSAAQSSQVYSLTGAGNSVNAFGYVPLVLGKFRFAGPLGAKSWTQQVGDDQYFNMLVVWGHPDMSVTDFRIGDTPLSDFTGVDHVFHGSTTGNDLKYFGRSYNEQSVGAALKYNSPVTRVIGECDSISIDIYSPAMADVSSGSTNSSSASFKIEYAPVGTEDWVAYGVSTRFYAPAQYRDCYTGAGQDDAWATSDGTWHVRQSGADWSNPNWTNGKIQSNDPHWSVYPIERYKDKHKHHEWWFREAYYDAGVSSNITISAAQTTPLTRSYEWAVPHGNYQIRITRTSPDSTSDTIYNDITWSTARAITNIPAFNTPIPICVSELRIKASEQLSGYVDNFNALCHSIFPVYNPETKGWTTDSEGDYDSDYTQNPADILRYLFTSKHALLNPYSYDKIDDAALADMAQWCIDKDLHFDFVCDSEASAWTRWTSVASAGRGSVTTDNDGLFGVVTDNDQKTVVQMFTPRNSWGFSIDRSFYKMPHALRVTFNDETQDYEEKEGFVYADGYDKSNAVDIVEWNVTGKTRWKDVYRFGRYYLASTKLRPITVTLSTDWEWLMCRRGDVVGVSHDVLMNTFGTARVIALIYTGSDGEREFVYREEDIPADGTLPIGVRLDDTVVFSEEAAFGIAIRNTNGNVLTYQVEAPFGEETDEMIFINPIVAAQVPYIGALASVSIFGQETAKYLVASISVSNDSSAELTLVPWAMPELIDSEEGPIPDWEPPVYIPQIGGQRTLPAPSIRDIKSDESMLKRSGNSIISCMGVWWQLPTGIDSSLGRLTVQGKIVKQGGGDAMAVFAEADSSTSTYILFENVEESATYRVNIRLVSDTGVTSDWSMPIDHTVIGKTSLPEKVKDFELFLDDPKGIRAEWTPGESLDIDHYEITGDFIVTTDIPPAYIQPYNTTGTVSESIQAVDVLNLKSEKVSSSIEILSPKTPVVQYARLLDNGINISFTNSKSSWSIDYYQIESNDPSFIQTIKAARGVIGVPTSWKKDDTVKVKAKDVFNNWSEYSEEALIEWFAPKTPDVVLGYDKITGEITLDWQDCRNDIEGAPSIAYYKILGTLTNQNNKAEEVQVVGTHYGAVVPLTAYEYGSQEDEDGTLINVGTISVSVIAVDKYGLTSEDDPNYVDNTVQFSIYPPYNPTNMALSSSDEGSSIVLTWKDCTRTFAIDYYLVTDESNKQTYKVSTNYVVLPARKEGTYKITIQAFDVIGHSSAKMTYNMVVAGVGGMSVTAKVDGSDILLEWSIPDSSFIIDHYIIKSDNDIIPDEGNIDFEDGDTVGTAKVNYFRVPAGASGTYVYYVWAVDVAGNISTNYASYTTITINDPNAPSVNAELAGDGVKLTWAASVGTSQLPIRAWDVVRQWDEERSDGVIETKEMEYGRLDVDTTTVPAFIAGEHTFMVRAIDSGGNIGPWGYVDFTASKPGRVTFTQPTVIDNNVQLYWTQPNFVFFPIKEYIFSEIETYEDGSEYEAEIGRIDALFASETENEAGMYTYGITPVDTGGNIGQRTTITCRVAQPPDFVFYDKKESLFNGTKTNMVLDGQGHMLGPVPIGETWLENILRVLQLTNTIDGDYEGAKIKEYDGKLWLRLYYLDAGDGGTNPLPETKEDAWDCVIGNTYYSKMITLRDHDELFRQSNGTLEFLAYQSEETGPISGDASIYSQWTQTENPCLVQYENSGDINTPLSSYKSIAKEGTIYPYGMALSTNSATLIDGQPYHSNYYGAVGQIRYHQNAAPYLTTQRYAQLYIRIDGTPISEAIESLTHQQKINAGYRTWLEPIISKGTYTETINHGTTIPSCNYTITLGYRVISGDPNIECKIEISSDNKVWETASDNAFSVFVTQFQYSRFTISVTGGYIEISSILVDLNVKQLTDYGRIECRATDNGEGWVSEQQTPMLTGTWVAFKRDFVDVQSLPKPNVVNHQEYTAFTVFEDVINPKGFRIFVKDKNGSRVTATVDWTAMGV